jgi:hypothetical protein
MKIILKFKTRIDQYIRSVQEPVFLLSGYDKGLINAINQIFGEESRHYALRLSYFHFCEAMQYYADKIDFKDKQ